MASASWNILFNAFEGTCRWEHCLNWRHALAVCEYAPSDAYKNVFRRAGVMMCRSWLGHSTNVCESTFYSAFFLPSYTPSRGANVVEARLFELVPCVQWDGELPTFGLIRTIFALSFTPCSDLIVYKCFDQVRKNLHR